MQETDKNTHNAIATSGTLSLPLALLRRQAEYRTRYGLGGKIVACNEAPLPVGLGDTLELVLFLDSVRVR